MTSIPRSDANPRPELFSDVSTSAARRHPGRETEMSLGMPGPPAEAAKTGDHTPADRS